MSRFERRLTRTLTEALAVAGVPKVVAVQFRPHRDGYHRVAVALFQDGARETLFSYDPDHVSFTAQELVGLDRQEARWLKDKKLDEAMGFQQF